jgi:hypothetical protein
VCWQPSAQAWLATHSALWTMVAGACGFGFFLALIALLDRYYARFGRVVMTKQLPEWARWLLPIAVSFLLSMPSCGFPNLFWIVVAAGPLWIAWDCRPLRWHHLLPAVAMLYVAFGRVAFPDAGGYAWMAPRLWALTGAFAITGILDHQLFVRAMRQTRALAAEAS